MRIDLLPALPTAWPEGSVTGLRTEGGFELDLAWSGGKLTHCRLQSLRGQPAELHCDEAIRAIKIGKGAEFKLNGDLQ